MTTAEAARIYNAHSAATGWAIFTLKGGQLYCWIRDGKLQEDEVVRSTSSANRGAKTVFRFRVPAERWDTLIAKGQAIKVMTEDEFIAYEEYAKGKYPKCTDRGRVCEVLMAESLGREWEWDAVPFTQAGDLSIGKAEVQIKFGKAHLASEQLLEGLG